MTNLPRISGLGEPQARGCQSQKNGLVRDENSVPYRGGAPGFLAGRVYGNLRAAEARCVCHFQKSSAQVPVNDRLAGHLAQLSPASPIRGPERTNVEKSGAFTSRVV